MRSPLTNSLAKAARRAAPKRTSSVGDTSQAIADAIAELNDATFIDSDDKFSVLLDQLEASEKLKNRDIE